MIYERTLPMGKYPSNSSCNQIAKNILFCFMTQAKIIHGRLHPALEQLVAELTRNQLRHAVC